MNIKQILFAVCLLLFVLAGTAPAAEKKNCAQCEMEFAPVSNSRVIITYSDGTSLEFCSIHCAVENMELHKDKQAQLIMVADYNSGKMIDASAAAWVIGGKQKGTMTSLPKWAFSKEEDASKFIAENGGSIVFFDEVVKKVKEELLAGAENEGNTNKGHIHSHMGPGSQLIYNPAFGDDIYHTHPAGMWMADYKFMYMFMDGLRSGTNNINTRSVGWMSNKQYNYMMIPTRMTMESDMLMLMYGVTDRFTIMGTANYLDNRMDMQMNMGMGMPYTGQSPMRTSGIGDTEVRGIYKINGWLNASLGLSIPTGGIKETTQIMGTTFRAPYDMQLGSGTYDLKPALTYDQLSDDALWNWGGQVMYTYHTGTNDGGYSLGDSLKITSWLQRALGPASAWLRTAFSDTGHIHGQDAQIQKILDPMMGSPMPDADPRNYGGQRLDGLLGTSIKIGPASVGVEGGIPIYQYLNGLQLKASWFLTAGAQVMF